LTNLTGPALPGLMCASAVAKGVWAAVPAGFAIANIAIS